MPDITFVKPFTLTRASGDQEYFTPGTYTVDDEVAGHWFALAHTADPPPPDIKVGTRAFVHTQLAEKRREALIAAVDESRWWTRRRRSVSAPVAGLAWAPLSLTRPPARHNSPPSARHRASQPRCDNGARQAALLIPPRWRRRAALKEYVDAVSPWTVGCDRGGVGCPGDYPYSWLAHAGAEGACFVFE